jgi:transcriptional regulator PpsR
MTQSVAVKVDDDVNTAAVQASGISRAALSGIDAEGMAMLIAAASDITLIIDPQGIVQEVAFGREAAGLESYRKWVGQLWIDTVTSESRPKVEALLEDASGKPPHKWRHVNHPYAGGADVPILYSVVRANAKGMMVAFGRDLRGIGVLQQRLVEAQQSMERDYWRLRHAETRYRVMFQMASEAVLIVDASTYKIVEANPAAATLFGDSVKRVVGRIFPDGFDRQSSETIDTLLAAARTAVKVDDVRVRMQANPLREYLVSVSMVRQESGALFLVRLAAAGGDLQSVPDTSKSLLIRAVESSPDGFVVTNAEGGILSANRAFADMTELVSEDLARGQSLGRWLGRPGVDMGVLISTLRQHGSVRLYDTTLHSDSGLAIDVEVSAVAVAVAYGEETCLGFAIRHIGQRLSTKDGVQRALPRSVEQMTELVGRVSLKELVRESTDLIEKLCIEAALELSQDNRASAAELLGLSRQSLYVKLRRYNLGDLEPETDL